MHAGYSFPSLTTMLAIICYNLAMCYCNVKYLLDFVLGWGLSSLRLCTRLIMLWSTPKYGIFLTHMLSIDRSRIVCYSGLLIFRAVVEPRISSKSVKSRKIHKNTQNPAKSREILPNACRHNIFESYLGFWGCFLAVNLPIYLETSSPQRVNNIPKLPGVLRLMLRKTGKQRCKNPGVLSVDHENWG